MGKRRRVTLAVYMDNRLFCGWVLGHLHDQPSGERMFNLKILSAVVHLIAFGKLLNRADR